MKVLIGFIGLVAIIVISTFFFGLTFHWMFPDMNGGNLYLISFSATTIMVLIAANNLKK